MTMFFRSLVGLTGVAAFLAGTQVASAGDVIPLKGTNSYNAQTVTLGNDGNSTTELTRGGGRGGGGHGGGGFHGGGFGGFRGGFGGFRGGYGGFRGGFGYGRFGYGGYGGYGYGGYGGWGGYYPYYYGGYYPYYYGGYYPYYGGYGYGGLGYGYVGNYGSPYYSVGVGSSPYVYTQPYLSNATPYGTAAINNYGYNGYNGTNGNVPVMPPVQSGDGTYPYNGGPTVPVPLPPQNQVNPAKTAPAAPTTLRLVSTPGGQQQQQSPYSYPAYGEDTRTSGFAIDRTVPTKKTNR
jgi:hypothetical protein